MTNSKITNNHLRTINGLKHGVYELKESELTESYKSYLSIKGDLAEVLEICDELLKNESPKNYLYKSVAITYGRAFANAPGRKMSLELGKLFPKLTLSEFELHNTIIYERNNYIAHHGVTLLQQCKLQLILDPNVNNKKVIGIGILDIRKAGSLNIEYQILKGLSQKIIKYCDEKLEAIKKGIINNYKSKIDEVYAKGTFPHPSVTNHQSNGQSQESDQAKNTAN